ncbi:MAG: hypothetical protein MRY79_05295 [Alphaproteobacteria bacterium]|nr:hypothetical protein [Alphaproteobacteria bacterium]
MIRTLLPLLLSLFFFLPSTATLADEGFGLISSDLNGALPKALWRDQPHSEIVYLLQNMPADAPMRSIQMVKRNMLLSRYDTNLIDNDIPLTSDHNLLTLRLQKLFEMGLWEDAFTLYTKTTHDPGDNEPLARIGVLLILLEKGLPTACLEEKVLSPRFQGIKFWTEMDAICDEVLGTHGADYKPEFEDSSVLQAIYHNPDFFIPATDINVLNKLAPLELIMLSQKRRINYDEISPEQRPTPFLTKLFLEAANFPESKRPELDIVATSQGLISGQKIRKKEKMSSPLSQADIFLQLAEELYLGHKISPELVQFLLENAPENPKNYVYIQILNDLGVTTDLPPVSQDNFNLGLTSFSEKMQKNINLLKISLDKMAKLSNNRADVYEKHIFPDENQMLQASSDNWIEWWENARAHNFLGISLLLVLNNIDMTTETLDGPSEERNDHNVEKIGDIPVNNRINILKRFSDVGLIEQTHIIAREVLADMIGLEK